MRALVLTALMAMASLQWADTADAQRRRGQARPAAAAAQAGAQHVAILDARTGILLSCDDCETPVPPASMSKLMTILLVAERLQAGTITENTTYPVSEYAWRNGAMSDGSHMFLELNSRVRVGDLVRGAIIVSANDACIALAEGISGSEEAFVAEMNRRAGELGLRSARFRNVTGLPDPEHRISTGDLARLARHLINNHPDIYRLYSQRTFTFNNRTQENRNPLLGAFTGADGVKTGHTNDSGYGLVGSALLNDQRRIIVFNGTRTMAERRSEALRLMRAAFHDFEVVTLAEPNAVLGEAQVYLGGRSTVPLVAPQGVYVGATHAQRAGLTAHIAYRGPIRAPIAQGQEVATLIVEGPGFARREYPLVAGRRVGGANWFAQAWVGLLRTFGGAS
jgi:serine-type D-Ala-D-Ala carboxypeptidase (penicillin-binding protein 5/6)